MVNALHQIQISYDSTEDRMLMKVSTTSGTEYRAWLTRRFIRSFYQGLCRTLKMTENAKSDGSIATKNLQLSASFQKNLSKANMQKKYAHKEGVEPNFPLGEKPFIAHKMIITESKSGHKVQLLPYSGKGIDLNLNLTLITPMIKMIHDAEKSADWGLDLILPGSMRQKEKLHTLLS